MVLKYLQEHDIESSEYISFFEKYHGKGSYAERCKRIHWYFKSENFRLLIAIENGNYVGQSCAYKVTAIVKGKEKELWWGVDGFVLKEMRGKGIGKALQKRLHEDCLNFTSASYSSVNGIIKKKCGAHELLGYHQYYCPVSCYCTLYAELALKKLISRKATVPRIRLPYLYGMLNKVGALSLYDVRELNETDFNEDLSMFMENSLQHKSFHIQRSVSYLRWKYLDNPSIDFVVLEFKKNGCCEAVVFFTRVYNGMFTISRAKVCKILDVVIKPGSELTQKGLLVLVAQYFKSYGIKLDGIMTLIPSSYWPQIKYPASSPFYMLSDLESTLLTDGYLAFSDQDMEQMYENI